MLCERPRKGCHRGRRTLWTAVEAVARRHKREIAIVNPKNRAISRRQFLAYLAGSPLAATFMSRELLAAVEESFVDRQPGTGEVRGLIDAPADALNVFDLEAVARETLPPAHWGYLATGVNDDATLNANHAAYRNIRLRARRLVDVSEIDTSVSLFGQEWPTPIVLCPVGSQKAFHPEGEIAVARAARTRNHLQILSSVTTSSVEDVTAARGAPVWYQLYPTSNFEITKQLLRRAEAAGCPAVALTVDLPVGARRETAVRFARTDTRNCGECHGDGPAAFFDRKPMYDGTGISGFREFMTPGLTWDFIGRLREATSMRLLIKGIGTREDAGLCVEHGVDGIIVSNHGGRSEESGMATIDSLPEVVAAVDGRMPVLIDGGIRRGTDIFKALALGADAVCIGRPYCWGLGAFGEAGVERVLALLTKELENIMGQVGATTVAGIAPEFLQT